MPRSRKLPHQRVGEVQAGGRRGDRAVRLGEHGLIVGAVALVGRAARRDIGRQRHVAAFVDRLVEHGAVERECQRHLPALAFRFDGRIELAEEADMALVAETDDVARREPLRRLDEGTPARAVDPLVQRGLDPGLGAATDPSARAGSPG